jgi:hypothetical protein
MDLRFPENVSAKAIFILPNQESGISIRSSSVSLEDVKLDGSSLSYQTLGSGEQSIYWPLVLGKPEVMGNLVTEFRLKMEKNSYLIQATIAGAGDVSVRPVASNE